jgi:hypothetical protein
VQVRNWCHTPAPGGRRLAAGCLQYDSYCPKPEVTLKNKKLEAVLKNLGIALACIVTIIGAASIMKPVFVSREPVARAIVARDRQLATITKPITEAIEERASPDEVANEMAQQEQAFYEDLIRAGHIDSARARNVARVAVREAKERNIPPALIFGIMLTENRRFVSKAKSNVGAVGLMQIYPKVWLKALGDKLGRDLANDETNLKYGAFIAAEYIYTKKNADTLNPTRSWEKPLLRYNGCVRGSNTPRCHTYPSKVRTYVESLALSLCEGEGFDLCVAQPVFLSQREKLRESRRKDGAWLERPRPIELLGLRQRLT